MGGCAKTVAAVVVYVYVWPKMPMTKFLVRYETTTWRQFQGSALQSVGSFWFWSRPVQFVALNA